MAFRFFKDENTAQSLGPGSNFQAGVNNVDASGSLAEAGFTVPWTFDPVVSWLDYACWLECRLDPGMARHSPLPQGPLPVDTLAAQFFDTPGAVEAESIIGVNTDSDNTQADVIQRMAVSSYLFVLRGYGLRAGYRVPIPGLLSIAGVPATPAEPQTAFNRVVGNYGGVPLFMARWELWYYVALPPSAQQPEMPNLAEKIDGNATPPAALQVPYSNPDGLAKTTGPGFILTTRG